MNEFNKIIGYEEIKEELYQAIDMIKNYDKYEEIGAKMPTGILLDGDPGLGKTLMANAFIKESGLRGFVLRKNTDKTNFIKKITMVFNDAMKNAPSIILLDDMDKFANDDSLHRDSEELVTLQACIDNAKGRGVFIIATTNSMDDLPDSLTRPGRFDKIIKVYKPKRKEACKIIKYYLKDKKVAKDINYDDVCNMMTFTSCATLEGIINEAAIYAAYDNKSEIDIEDIKKAVLRDIYHSPESFKNDDPEAMRMVARHEAGHAVVAEILNPCSVGLISIQNRCDRNQSGITHMCESSNRRPIEVAIGLGGKVACEMYEGGKVASGCGYDLRRVAHTIGDGIVYNSTLGYSFISSYVCDPSWLNETKLEIAVSVEMEKAELKVKEILIKNKEFLEKLIDELVEKQTLLYSDIQRIRNTCNIINVEI